MSRPDGQRVRARRLDPEIRRPLILDAALRVWLREGYEGASMDAIAAEAEVTKPVLYGSFPGKRELFEAVLAREQLVMVATVVEGLPERVEIDRPEEAMHQGFRALFDAVVSRPDAYRATAIARHSSDKRVRQQVEQSYAVVETQVAALTRAWLDSVQAADAERRSVAAGIAFVALGDALSHLLLEKPARWTAAELAAFACTLASDGLRGVAAR